MTEILQNFDSLQEKNQQVLNNISQLQIQEKELYTSLDNVTLSTEQKQQIINKINEISQMRMNLYANLKETYSICTQTCSRLDVLIDKINNFLEDK